MCAKFITEQQLIGELGVALIQQRVLQMGWLWHSRGAVEAGIDGHIEIREPGSREALNLILLVQSKATMKRWEAETPSSFVFRCDRRDVEYWLRSNVPVILVVTRPSTNEAYWVNVKEYLHRYGQAGKIQFDKSASCFNAEAREELTQYAARDSGFYQPPLPIDETLFTNLLTVEALPAYVYEAETAHRDSKSLRDALPPSYGRFCIDGVLKSGTLISFQDLTLPPLDHVCDVNSLQKRPALEWCDDDADRTRTFVHLLNCNLKAMLYRVGVLYHEKHRYFFFQPGENLEPLKIPYMRDGRESSLTVFSRYGSKKGKTVCEYYRHGAFSGRFVRYDRHWYLEITPTHHYTSDGCHAYSGAQKMLSGLKRMEKNDGVLSQVMFWADFIAGSGPLVPTSGTVRFGSLVRDNFPYGIKDAQGQQTGLKC